MLYASASKIKLLVFSVLLDVMSELEFLKIFEYFQKIILSI